MKTFTIISLVMLFVMTDYQAHANQFTPRPTPLTREGAEIRTPRPRVMSNFSAPVVRFDGVRLEASSQSRMVFSSTDGFSRNRRLYYWVPGGTKLVNTELDGVPQSVIMPEHGRYMVYLYDELDTQADLNGDGVIDQVLLRFYHFDSARHVTIGIPARSGEEEIKAIPDEPRSKRLFEYKLVDDQLIFSVSPRINNHSDGSDQLRASWQIVDMNQFVYQIIGTPTPTHTPTPTPSNTATPTDTPEPTSTYTPTIATPSLTPTPTGFPTVPPEMRTSADLNNDQVVDTLDLLLFKMFWRQSTVITPTPTIAF